jgi:hypothetical protein
MIRTVCSRTAKEAASAGRGAAGILPDEKVHFSAYWAVISDPSLVTALVTARPDMF